MTVPILILYGFGFVFFFMGTECIESKGFINIIYLGLAFFTNLIGYLSSYSDTSYTTVAYFPLVLMMLSVILLFYAGVKMIPVPESWDVMADKED